jgi:hypothetical protein
MILLLEALLASELAAARYPVAGEVGFEAGLGFYFEAAAEVVDAADCTGSAEPPEGVAGAL